MGRSKEEKVPPENVELHFYAKNVYGRYLYYPANEWAKKAIIHFNQHSNKKPSLSFSREKILFLKEIGVKIKIVANEEI